MEFSLDNDLDYKDLDEIKALIIDVPSPPSTFLNVETSKVFFTLLDVMKKAEKMATKLADRSFSPFFITISNVLSNYINSANAACDTIDTNLFAYIATNWYLFDKFYGIMIVPFAFKHFTTGYRQFMAYTREQIYNY